MNASTVTYNATYFLYTSLTHTHTDAKVQRPCHMPDLACHCNYIPALSVTPIPPLSTPLPPTHFTYFSTISDIILLLTHSLSVCLFRLQFHQ